MSILKKLFFLSLLLFVISLLLWGVYNVSFKTSETAKNGENNEALPTPSAETGKQNDNSKIGLISEELILAPKLNQEGNKIRYFSLNSKKVYEMDLDGSNIKNIFKDEISGLTDAFWSEDGQKAIIKVKNQSNEDFNFIYHNFSDNSQIPIGKSLDSVYWQPGANRIFYKYYDSKTRERSLNIADPDGTNWKKLADINFRNIFMAQVPKSGLISYWNRGDAYQETEFTVIPLIGGEAKIILKSKYGADYLWNGDGTKALASLNDEKGGRNMQLAVMNYNGGEYKNLNIPTFISKCAWSKDNKTVYYSIPGFVPDNSVLPNDYKEGKFTTADTFWKVDIETGEKKRLLETNEIKEKYDVSNLFLNQDESLLFFINKIDGKLYSLPL